MGVSVGWIFPYPFLLATLLLVGLATAQYIDRPYDNSGSNSYADPLRGTLGVWARLLSRMAQTNPPTDDQLHLRDEKGGNPFDGSLSSASTAMKDIYDNMRSNLNKLAHMPTNLVMGGGGSATAPPLGGISTSVAEPVVGGDFITVPVQTTASPTAAKSSEQPKIINEQKLLELLPRLRENPSTQPSPTTAPTSTTPEMPTTRKKDRRKKSKQGKTTPAQSTTASDATTTTAGESIDASTTTSTSQATPYPSLSNSDSTQASSTPSGSELRTSDATMSAEESNRNGGDRNDTTASSIKHDKNSTLSSTENETGELIKEIENVLKEEQWIFHNRRRGNSSHFDAEKGKHVSAQSKNNSADGGARTEETHAPSSNGKGRTAEGTADDDEESKESSESEPESSESDESSEEEGNESTPAVKEHGENNDSDYSKIPVSTSTTATPTSTGTRITTTTVTTTAKSTTVQPTSKTVRKKDHKKVAAKDKDSKKKSQATYAPKATTRTLPEAEEEEKTGDVAQQNDAPTTTSKPKAAKLGSLFNGPSLGIDSYSSKDMASMIRPVNTIIDGIGPLILPLLGYSREALAGSYAPQVSLVRPRVKTGVAIHRPGYAYHQPPPSQVAIRAPAAARQYAAVQNGGSGAVSSQVPQAPVLPRYPPSSRLHPNYRHVPTSGGELPSDSQSGSHVPHARYMPDPPIRESHVAPAYLQRLQQAAQLSRSRAAEAAAAVAAAKPQQPIPTPNVFAPDTIRQTLDTILLQRRANQQGLQGQTSPYWEQQPSVNHQAPPVYEQEPLSTGGRVEAASTGDSGYDAGRSGVEKTFFEDSGVMIGGGGGDDGGNNNKKQQKSSPLGRASPFGIKGAESEVKKAAPKPGGSGTIGFGGGRQPDMGFEEVSANTSNFQ